ncbi:MAG TPA: hypothetical protein VFA11_00290 [Acidimicrobiales bacterium]|nr:hypothetical protein [Acidimicrobiales bacterium]
MTDFGSEGAAGGGGWPRIAEGTRVDVRSSFDGRWSGGFLIVDAELRGSELHYRLQRVSDGRVLPGLQSEADVMPSAPAS